MLFLSSLVCISLHVTERNQNNLFITVKLCMSNAHVCIYNYTSSSWVHSFTEEAVPT